MTRPSRTTRAYRPYSAGRGRGPGVTAGTRGGRASDRARQGWRSDRTVWLSPEMTKSIRGPLAEVFRGPPRVGTRRTQALTPRSQPLPSVDTYRQSIFCRPNFQLQNFQSQTPSNTREIIMISLDYYTTWGEVRSYTPYFPLHRKEGGGNYPLPLPLPQPPLLGTFKNLVMLLPYPSCFDFPLRS